MTVLASENTNKFFALNLTTCLSVETTERQDYPNRDPNSIFELRDKNPDSIPAMN